MDGNVTSLKNIEDEDLVAEAEKASAGSFGFEDGWQNLCQSDPDRALRGLNLAAAKGMRPERLWEQMLWSRSAYSDADTEGKIAEQLLQWPVNTFSTIAAAASAWLDGHAKNLPDELVWPLWDRIADAALTGDTDA